MNKMTKKKKKGIWRPQTKKWSPKTEFTQKMEQDRPCSKILTFVKKSMVNNAGQRSEVNGQKLTVLFADVIG